MHKQFLQEGFYPCLDHLMEECGEVVQISAKIHRFGIESVNPLLSKELQETNLVRLLKELSDLEIAIKRIYKEIDIYGSKKESNENYRSNAGEVGSTAQRNCNCNNGRSCSCVGIGNMATSGCPCNRTSSPYGTGSDGSLVDDASRMGV